MKKNKIIILLFVAFLMFGFAGCGKKKEAKQTFDQAYAYLKGVYKDASTQTLDDYKLVSKVKIGDSEFSVKWSVTITTGKADAVKVVEKAGELTVIDIDKFTDEECKYVLKATISDGEDNSAEITYDKIKPAFIINTHAEYVAAEVSAPLNCKGVVTGKFFSATSKKANFYFQDSDGGYYGYNITTTQEQFDKVQIGSTILVSGVKDLYSGTLEVKEGTFELLDDEVKPLEPIDVTDLYINSTDDTALVAMQGSYVIVKGVDMVGIDDKYLNFTLANKQRYVYISSSTCLVDAAGQKVLKDKTVAGNYANISGIVAQFSGAFQILPITSDSISLQERPDIPHADKVADAKSKVLALADKVYSTNLDLFTKTGYPSVSVVWTSSNTDLIAVNGKLGDYPLEETEVELTAVIKSGDVEETVKIKVKVAALARTTIASNFDKYADAPSVWLEGKIIGKDTNGYFFIADETGIAYVYDKKLSDLTDIAIGDNVKIIGSLTLYVGSKNNQFTREVMAKTVEKIETVYTPSEAVIVDLSDLIVNPYATQTVLSETDLDALTASKYQGFMYSITGYVRVKTSGTFTNIYICEENNDTSGAVLYHYKSDFQTEIKEYAGKLVTIVAPMFDYAISYGWRIGPYTSITEVEAPATVPAGQNTVAEVIAAAKDAEVSIVGTITHVYAKNGITVKDATGAVYVYSKSLPTYLSVGDVVRVSGKKGTYNEAAQITGTVTCELLKIGSYEYAPTTMDAAAVLALVSTDAANFGKEISVDGQFVVSDGFVNFKLTDGTVLSAYMSDSEKELAKTYADKNITITIITYNYKNGKFNIFVALETVVEK